MCVSFVLDKLNIYLFQLPEGWSLHVVVAVMVEVVGLHVVVAVIMCCCFAGGFEPPCCCCCYHVLLFCWRF